MPNSNVVVVLELTRGPTGLRGSMREPDGSVTEFHGWLGLATGIDDALSSHVAAARAPQGRE